ncbi:hypothetical protein C0215_19910, partial [Clostridioides difficile]|uniref:hypothetical protein n=1 Tax=Clostridioides difficile TaxID=1496 RepID=UPI000EB9EB61
GRSLASLSELRILRCCELQCRPQTRLRTGVAVAVAYAGGYCWRIGPLAWELPYAAGAALKRKKKKKKSTKTIFSDLKCQLSPVFIQNGFSFLFVATPEAYGSHPD